MKISLRFFTTLQGIILLLIMAIFLLTILFGFFASGSVANDQKRITDVGKIQAALKVSYDVNGFYPDSLNNQPKGIDSILDFWPTPPSPNGQCSTLENAYTYSQLANGSDYSLNFCLGHSEGNLLAGPHMASREGIK